MERAIITQYLLEKTRVVEQPQGERNFHIFYMICNHLDQESRAEMFLRPEGEYGYLRGTGEKLVRAEDAAQWKDVLKSMASLGFSEDDVSFVFEMLSAILNLGNVSFCVDEREECYVSEEESLATVSKLLKIDCDALRDAMCVVNSL